MEICPLVVGAVGDYAGFARCAQLQKLGSIKDTGIPVDFFLFGHRHIELDLALSRQTRVVILGDWITQFSYAVYNGEQLYLENYTEGEAPL